ncbi:MAG: ribosome recycling factor [Candidatus Magasanikbacteria bacterium]|nr:ribosome recycling factor [Candidatus Magasanikbacteria bacterium]
MIAAYEIQFEKTLEHTKHEISGLRTGRATPALVEDLSIEAYGVRQSLKALASIRVLDAKTIMVEPWDKSILQNIESGFRNSQIGINPVNDGSGIRLALPDLTQERRSELIKVLHQKLEQGRIAVRKIREEAKADIETSYKEKNIGEDEKFKWAEELEKMVKEYNEKLKVMGEEKEKEIITV